jgi:hypothetical protein
MAIKKLPPRDLVRQLLEYNPATGEFTWLPRPREMFSTYHHWQMWNTQNAGKPAGSRASTGGFRLSINDAGFAAHRIAWLIIYGEPVPNIIDHADHNPLNSSIANLRAASGAQNRANSKIPSDNTTGAKGIGIEKGRFRARIMSNGKRIHLGSFDTVEEAAAAYRKAAISLHGAFARWD